MTAIIGQSVDILTSYIFDEIEINNGSTPEVCDLIKERYKKWMGNLDITGDATGHNRSALIRGNLNHYRIIKEALELYDRNILVERTNPAHRDSQILCNSVLQNAKVLITENCTRLINDLHTANVDHEGELVKNAQMPLHLFDGFRYFIHARYGDFISSPRKYQP